jgi:transcriptional regulator with XRE-family HTH domain
MPRKRFVVLQTGGRQLSFEEPSPLSLSKPMRSSKLPTGAVLRQILEALGLTQADLATLLDLVPGTVSDWERSNTLRRTKLDRIADRVGIAPQVVDALLAAHQLLRQTLPAALPILLPFVRRRSASRLGWA